MCVCEKIRQEKKELGENEKKYAINLLQFLELCNYVLWIFLVVPKNRLELKTSDGSGTGNLGFHGKMNLRQVKKGFSS